MIKNNNLNNIIEKLRNDETRWDAILELKLIQNPKDVSILINLLSDQDWVVRWAVAEKLGDYRDAAALTSLSELLVDPDIHVRKNAKKALLKYQTRCLPAVVPYLQHKDLLARNLAYQIILGLKETSIPALEKILFPQNMIIGSRIIHAIWAIGGELAEKTLVKLLEVPHFQLQAIILLANLKSRLALPKLVGLYRSPKLRKPIMVAFKQLGEDVFFEYIVNLFFSSTQAKKSLAEEIILKVGKFIVPSLIRFGMKSKESCVASLALAVKISPEVTFLAIGEIQSAGSRLTPELLQFVKKYKRSVEEGKSGSKSILKMIEGFF